MQMPNRHSGSYRYLGANGQESETEITGDNSHSSAEYWMYDNRLGRRWNLDPKLNNSFNPYACFDNNPLYFLDTKGDSIDISGLNWFTESEYNEAFKAFINTEEGYNFLKDYAGAGQNILGVTFEEDGIYHSQGINISYEKWVTQDEDESGNKVGVPLVPAGGVTQAYDVGNPTNGSFPRMNIYIYIGKGFGTKSSVLNKTQTIIHESFIHAAAYVKDFLYDCDKNYKEIDWDIKNNADEMHYHHAVENKEFEKDGWSNKNDLWPNRGLKALKEAKKYLGIGSVTDSELKKALIDYEGSEIKK